VKHNRPKGPQCEAICETGGLYQERWPLFRAGKRCTSTTTKPFNGRSLCFVHTEVAKWKLREQGYST